MSFTSDKDEHDPRWSDVDAYATTHLHSSSTDTVLESVYSRSLAAGMPDISVYAAFGKFLALQAKLVRATHVLEVGTLGGYGAIAIALRNPGVKVMSLEIDEQRAQVARENVDHAGLDESTVEIIVAPALETLKSLKAEIDGGSRPRFGLVFIDADKGNNAAYFDYAIESSISGTPIVVDNVVRKGDVVDQARLQDPGVAGSRKVIEMAGKDPRVESCLMQTVSEKSYDGFLYAVVK